MIKTKRLFSAATALILCFSLAVVSHGADAEGTVILGGNAFGIRLCCDALSVVALEDVETKQGRVCPALDAGVCEGDEIVSVNGKSVKSAEEFTGLIENFKGEKIGLTLRRGEETKNVVIYPAISAADSKPRLGIWVRDSTAGIGTMTFILPDTLAFGALGHGIGDSSGEEEKDETQSDAQGAVFEVEVSSVKRGQSGSPGELRGNFENEKIGTVVVNSGDGVFGVCSRIPEELEGSPRITLCTASQVREGPAKLYCTLGGDGIRSYDVNVSEISKEEDADRSFVVTVTDRRLIERTGGIVRGMSGSPLVQDGKLIGAVTHVMISDPTKGYGIFIDNMLEELPAFLR